MRLPTLVIAGAQKCGTTSLAAALGEHPQIFMSRKKELHYFDRPGRSSLREYKAHFRPDADHVHAGEATPVYMYLPAARRRMARRLPDARIVVILRDPAKRAYSHYWHERRRGTELLPTFEEALAAEPGRLATGRQLARTRYSYADRGHYIGQLEALAAGHGHENLHTLLMDDLVNQPVPTLTALLDFLEVDSSLAIDLPVEKHNPYRVVEGDGTTRPATYPAMAEETRALLVERYREDNERLAVWWGRDLDPWNRV